MYHSNCVRHKKQKKAKISIFLVFCVRNEAPGCTVISFIALLFYLSIETKIQKKNGSSALLKRLSLYMKRYIIMERRHWVNVLSAVCAAVSSYRQRGFVFHLLLSYHVRRHNDITLCTKMHKSIYKMHRRIE